MPSVGGTKLCEIVGVSSESVNYDTGKEAGVQLCIHAEGKTNTKSPESETEGKLPGLGALAPHLFTAKAGRRVCASGGRSGVVHPSQAEGNAWPALCVRHWGRFFGYGADTLISCRYALLRFRRKHRFPA